MREINLNRDFSKMTNRHNLSLKTVFYKSLMILSLNFEFTVRFYKNSLLSVFYTKRFRLGVCNVSLFFSRFNERDAVNKNI